MDVDATDAPDDPVQCPLCGQLVSRRPDPDAQDVRRLGRHLEKECRVRLIS